MISTTRVRAFDSVAAIDYNTAFRSVDFSGGFTPVRRSLIWDIRFACINFWCQSNRVAYPAMKRILDIAVASVMLTLLSPLFVVLAIAIRAADGGPAIFWQKRVGRWGRIFWFPKFRSMVPNAEQLQLSLLDQNRHGQSVTFKIENDPRITRIGRWIRRASLDELPQLWSVLVGDMTLVGPRPAVPREVGKYTLADRRRLEVTPGLTCIWQVNGRSKIPFEQQVEMDIDYINRCSMKLDLSLLLQTIPAVLSARGAC